MKRTPTLLLRRLVLCCAWLSLLALAASCGSSARATRQPDTATATVTEKALTEDEQRKFEYFLIEASRLKQSGDYDAALEMYEHCLSIDPTSGAVLYEMAYFYTMLNQADRTASSAPSPSTPTTSGTNRRWRRSTSVPGSRTRQSPSMSPWRHSFPNAANRSWHS